VTPFGPTAIKGAGEALGGASCVGPTEKGEPGGGFAAVPKIWGVGMARVVERRVNIMRIE